MLASNLLEMLLLLSSVASEINQDTGRSPTTYGKSSLNALLRVVLQRCDESSPWHFQNYANLLALGTKKGHAELNGLLQKAWQHMATPTLLAPTFAAANQLGRDE